MASPIADYVVSLGTDGHIQSQGSLSKIVAKDAHLAEELAEEQQEIAKIENEVDQVEADEGDSAAKTSDGKLVVAEEISVGHVSLSARQCDSLLSG